MPLAKLSQLMVGEKERRGKGVEQAGLFLGRCKTR
jgi:hypothetical protein